LCGILLWIYYTCTDRSWKRLFNHFFPILHWLVFVLIIF
jgi:hypothetical protein